MLRSAHQTALLSPKFGLSLKAKVVQNRYNDLFLAAALVSTGYRGVTALTALICIQGTNMYMVHSNQMGKDFCPQKLSLPPWLQGLPSDQEATKYGTEPACNPKQSQVFSS